MFDRQGHQGQVLAEGFAGEGEGLDEGGFDGFVLQEVALVGGEKVYEGMEVGVGIGGEHLLDDALGACVVGKPFMD